MPYGLAAYQLREPTFNPAGMLSAAADIQNARTRNNLMQLQVTDTEERRRALSQLDMANPASLSALNRFPDLHAHAVTGMTGRLQYLALENARAAQRVMDRPAGSPERRAAWEHELQLAGQFGRIDPARQQAMMGQEPSDQRLRGIIAQAQPIESEQQRMQTELLRAQTERLRRGQEIINELMGGGSATGAGTGTGLSARELLATGGGLSGIALDTSRLRPGANRDILAGDGADFPGANALLGNAGGRSYSNVSAPPVMMGAPSSSDAEWTALARARGMGMGAMPPPDRFAEPIGKVGQPPPLQPLQPVARPASPAQAMLPVDPRALSDLALQATPQAPAPDAMAGAARDFSTSLATPGAPATPTAPAGRGQTAGIGGALREAFGRLTREDQIAMMLALIKDDYSTVANIVRGVTPGTEAVDRKYADEYAGWTAGGGAADVQRQLAQLSGVERTLADPRSNITGGPHRQLPGFIADALDRAMNPQALASRQRVEEVVQRSLRQILGPQFTEAEATRLIERAYDPALPQPENLRRVQALLTQIGLAAQAKQEAAAYFGRFGTLRGWEGRVPSMADFNMLFETPGGGTQTQTLTPEQALSLPPGTEFRGTDGNTYRVPNR